MLMGFGNTVAAQHSVEYEPIPEDFERLNNFILLFTVLS